MAPLTAALLPSAALAQAATNNSEQRELTLGTIVISGKKNPITALPSSSTVVGGQDLLDRASLQQGADLLRVVPGLQVSSLGQGGFRDRFVIRGFASAGESVAAFLDGVPLNESNGHGDGTIDLSTVIPEEIDRIEVIKGPFSALYGNFARAGSLSFVTKNRVDEGLASVSLGTEATRRLALTLGRKGETVSQYYALEAYRTDGYRDRSDTKRTNFAARWTVALSPNSTVRFGGRNYDADWEGPGYLTEAEWNAGAWRQTNTQVDAGKKRRYDLNLNYNYRIGEGENFGVTAFRYSTDFIRWRKGEGRVAQTEEHNVLDGTMLKLLYLKQGSFLTKTDTLLFGVDVLRENGLRRTWNNTTPFARAALTADGDYRQDTYSAYTQLEMAPLERLGVVLGARYDYFDVALQRQVVASGVATGVAEPFDNTLSSFSPKAGLSYRFNEAFEVFGNAAKGFYLPSSFDKFLNSQLKPVDLVSYEIGLRFRPIPQVKGSIALYRLDSEGDVTRQGGPTGPLVNAGDIRRQGLELEVTADLTQSLRFVGSTNHVDATFRNYSSAGVDLSGKTPIEVPPYFYSAALDYAHAASGFGARVTLNGKGAVWLDNTNRFRNDGYRYVDARVYYNVGPATIDLKVGNLTNRRYADYAFAGTTAGSQQYGPARGRNAMLTLRLVY